MSCKILQGFFCKNLTRSYKFNFSFRPGLFGKIARFWLERENFAKIDRQFFVFIVRYQWSRFFLLYTLPLGVMSVAYWKISNKLWSNEDQQILYSAEGRQLTKQNINNNNMEPQESKVMLKSIGRGRAGPCSYILPNQISGVGKPPSCQSGRNYSQSSDTARYQQAQNEKIQQKIQAKRKVS